MNLLWITILSNYPLELGKQVAVRSCQQALAAQLWYLNEAVLRMRHEVAMKFSQT